MSLVRTLDNLFGYDFFESLDHFGNLLRFNYDQSYLAPLDLVENSDEYIIEAEIPGFDKEEIEINAASDYLEIQAKQDKENNTDKEEDGIKYIRRERSSSNIKRRINFKTPIKPKEAKVTMENGVLRIVLPKSEEAKAIKLLPK